MKLESLDHSLFSTQIGADITYMLLTETGVFSPSLSVGGLRDYGDKQTSAATSFVGRPETATIKSTKHDADALLGGVSLDALLRTRGGDLFGIKAAYNVELRESSASHSVFTGAEWRF